jgi:hypothetical protein
MKLIPSILLLALFSALGFGATVTASSTKIGGESGSACSDTKTDGTTASCKATFVSGRGAAISSYWNPVSGSYKWFGAITRTQAVTNYSIRSKATANFVSEFNGQNSSGHGVVLTYDMSGDAAFDGASVDVYVKDAFGSYPGTPNATISRDNTTYTVDYSGTALDILLVASDEGAGVFDTTSLFHVDLTAF